LSEFEKLKVVTKYELLKLMRRRRFYAAILIAVAAVGLAAALYRLLDLPNRVRTQLKALCRQFLSESKTESLLDQAGIKDSPEFFAHFVASMGTLALIGAVFFSGDAIASEFEDRTGYLLFPNPVKRTTLVAGKYLACLTGAIMTLATGYLLSALLLLLFYQQVPVGLIESFGVAITLACFMVSLAFAFSSELRGGIGATIATLVTYGVVFSIISSALSMAGYDPWYMPDRAGGAVSETYGISYAKITESLSAEWEGLREMGVLRGMLRASSQNPLRSSLLLLGYGAILFPLSLWLTNRREMV
jgi:ABC-2 type transport system permease protein